MVSHYIVINFTKALEAFVEKGYEEETFIFLPGTNLSGKA
jgi:hypothetical protein